MSSLLAIFAKAPSSVTAMAVSSLFGVESCSLVTAPSDVIIVHTATAKESQWTSSLAAPGTILIDCDNKWYKNITQSTVMEDLNMMISKFRHHYHGTMSP